MEDWRAYEEATRKQYPDVRVSQIVPKGMKWKHCGTYFSDGGYYTIVSAEYLAHDAARTIMFERDSSTEDLEYGDFLEMMSLNGG